MYPPFLFMFYLSIDLETYSISEITEIMGIAPTEAWMKGDPWGPFKKQLRQSSQWTLQLNHQFDADIVEHLSFFVRDFEPYKDKIKLIGKNNNINVHVVVNHFTESLPPILLTLEMVHFLSYINAEIDFDMYNCCEYGPVSIPFKPNSTPSEE